MPTDRQLDDRISRWLEAEAPTRLPDRVLRATFERTRETRQQAGWRAVLGGLQMNRLIAPLAAGAMGVFLVVVGFAFLNNPRTPAADETARPQNTPVVHDTPAAQATTRPAVTATASPTDANSPTMSQPRAGHTATRMGSRGLVYLIGGVGSEVDPTDTIDVFDPRTGTFSPSEQRLGEARAFHTATLLFDTQSETFPGACLLLIGGYGPDGFRDELSSAENYVTGNYSDGGPENHPCSLHREPSMHAWRVGHTATLLTDGRVLVIGGNYEVDVPAEIWQPDTGLFTDVISPTDLPSGRHTATVLEDGDVLIAGYVSESVEDPTFPPGADSFTQYPTRRAVAYLFDPETTTFSETGDMQAVRQTHEALRLHDGTVLLVGEGSAEIYDPSTGLFTATASPPGEYATMTLMDDGRVLLTGGINWATDDQRHDARDWAAAFDPQAGQFTDVGPMTFPRDGHSATVLEDGRVLIAGGSRSASDGEEGLRLDVLHSFEFFDPTTDTFAAPR